MMRYEYKVVPAPTKGTKAKGVKTPEGRFAGSVEAALNAQAGEGWEYCRAELLPSEERTGLTGSTTNWRNVLVFRRVVEQVVKVKPGVPPKRAVGDAVRPARPRAASGAERMLKDDGVEELSPVSGMTSALRSRARQQAGKSEDGAQAADEGPGAKDQTPGRQDL